MGVSHFEACLHACSDGCDKDLLGPADTIHPWLVVPLHRAGLSVQSSVAVQTSQKQQLTSQ